MVETESLGKPNKQLSVVLAVRNEIDYISKCLDSLLDQDFPQTMYEIIVIDGMSNDGTSEILNTYETNHPGMIKVLKNQGMTQAKGRNMGIAAALAELILIFSGHATANRQFLMTLVKMLNESPPNVASIGGVHFPPSDETFLGKVMADVQNSLLGGGGTSYRYKSSKQYVDTVAFCVYRKNILEEVGLYDENFEIGEDVELNWRIRKKGYKLMVTQNAISNYYRKHSSFKLLAKRMFYYGLWRALVTKKHPDSFKFIFCIPILLLISIISLPILILFNRDLANIVMIALIFYLIAILVSSLNLALKQKSIKYFSFAVSIYVIEHLSLAAGFIRGLAGRLQNDKSR